jgi:hypothetical protein
MTNPQTPPKQGPIRKAKAPVPRVPAKRPPKPVANMSPKRLGTIVASILVGDTLRAACGAAAVPVPTYHRWAQQGAAAINQARTLTGEDDMEGAIWQVLEDHGVDPQRIPSATYWSAPPPDWWPKALADRWLHSILVILVYWARGQSEQVYRQVITRAATGGDWKAAEFMLTHSFGWSKTDVLELTGVGGEPLVAGNEDTALAALALLADRRKAIER